MNRLSFLRALGAAIAAVPLGVMAVSKRNEEPLDDLGSSTGLPTGQYRYSLKYSSEPIVEPVPDHVQEFTVVRTEPSGRIVAQSPLLSNSINQDTIDEIIAHPEDFEVRIVGAEPWYVVNIIRP